jgi:hypothetical protein
VCDVHGVRHSGVVVDPDAGRIDHLRRSTTALAKQSIMPALLMRWSLEGDRYCRPMDDGINRSDRQVSLIALEALVRGSANSNTLAKTVAAVRSDIGNVRWRGSDTSVTDFTWRD